MEKEIKIKYCDGYEQIIEPVAYIIIKNNKGELFEINPLEIDSIELLNQQ